MMRATIANASESEWARMRAPRRLYSPPPCGEGSGVGVHTKTARGVPPTPTLPRKGGGSLNIVRPSLRERISALQSRAGGDVYSTISTVIASEAKQSRTARAALDCFVALAPRNDDPIHSDNNN